MADEQVDPARKEPGGSMGEGESTVGCVGGNCGPAGPSQQQDIIDIGPAMSRPRPTCRPPVPTMPEQARLMGITGAVVVRYVVRSDGEVGAIQIVNSNATPVLAEAVRQWLTSCRFEPSFVGGRPVAVRVEQPFLFRLR